MGKTTLFQAVADKWKNDRNITLLAGIFVLSIISSIVCGILYNVNGSYVAPDGMVVESFGYVVLGFLFAFSAFLSGTCLGIVILIRRSRRKHAQ